MAKHAHPASDVAFTPRVKEIQARLGSRTAYARMERGDGWSTTLDEELAEFIAGQRSVFLATANPEGQPYIQHRGGPPGFLRVVDETTIAFADYRGNRQFISMGNLVDNPKVHLFLIDYLNQRRVKIWGEARVVEDDPALVATLMPAGYVAKGERAIVVRVIAWDSNCPQHIPQRFEADAVRAALDARDQRIAALEQELRALRLA